MNENVAEMLGRNPSIAGYHDSVLDAICEVLNDKVSGEGQGVIKDIEDLAPDMDGYRIILTISGMCFIDALMLIRDRMLEFGHDGDPMQIFLDYLKYHYTTKKEETEEGKTEKREYH